MPGVREPVRPAAAARGCGSELSGLRRYERAEAGLGLRGRVEGIPGTPPRAFQRLRVRWRLQLSELTRLRLRAADPDPQDVPEAHDAEQGRSIHDRKMPEALAHHDLGGIIGVHVEGGGHWVAGHPLGDRR